MGLSFILPAILNLIIPNVNPMMIVVFLSIYVAFYSFTWAPWVIVGEMFPLGEEGFIRGVPSRKYLGICLETQGLPDAIHHPTFPSVILDKEEKYRSVTKYRFGVE